MIDSHCHIYVEEFGEELDAVLQRAEESGVTSFYMPAIDSSTHEAMMETESKYFGKCFSMMGLHPCSVNESANKELAIIESYLQQRAFAAIGEIGLDFYWDTSYKNEQIHAFHKQIEWALQYKLPIVIHSRNATKECIDVVKQYSSAGLKGIFHCFGGSIEEAVEITSMNFLLGIGGVLTYKNSKLDQTLKDIDLKYIVLETDAPYLTPVPFRGKRNEPAYLKYVAEKIAEVKQITLKEVIEITSDNAKNIFHAYT